MENLSQNIKKNYLYIFLRSFNLADGIWMLYLVNVKGFSLYQAGLLEAIFHVTSILMEIPTGAVADIWGRKISRAAGRIAAVGSALMMIGMQGFSGIALAFVLSALSFNLESGAGQALIYDTLKLLGREEEFAKLVGYNELIAQIAIIGGLTAGAWLAGYNYNYAYVGVIVLGILATVQTLRLREPELDDSEEDTEVNNWRTFRNKIKDSLRVVKSNKTILYYMLLFESLGATITSVKFYLQNYLADMGYNLVYIGLTLSLAAVISALFATQTYRLENAVGERRMVQLLPIVCAALLWGFSLTSIPIVFFILLMGIDAVAWVVFSKYLNAMIPSNRRATILSMSSMVFSVFMIIIFPLVGAMGDQFGLALTFRGLAGGTTLIALVNYFKKPVKIKG